MQKNFELAEFEFNKSNYKKARILYGMCVGATELSASQQNSAAFMVAYLFLKESNFGQAQYYIKQLDKNKKLLNLPKKLKTASLEEIVQEAILEAIKNPNTTELDLSNYDLGSKALQNIFENLINNVPKYPVKFSKKSLQLLAEINLEHIPVNKEILKKLAELLTSISTGNIEVPFNFVLKLGVCQTEFVVKFLSHALRKVKNKHIRAEFTDPSNQEKKALQSGAVIEMKVAKQVASEREQVEKIGKLSTDILSKLIKTNYLNERSAPEDTVDINQKSIKKDAATLYSDEDIDLVIKTKINQFGGIKTGLSYLLTGNESETFVGNDEIPYHVLVTPAVNTEQLTGSIAFFLDKNLQPLPDKEDHRHDVFDEIDTILSEDEAHIKILFPFQDSQEYHWLTGELRLHKVNDDYRINMTAHDPYGAGQFSTDNFQILCNTIRDKILLQNPNAVFQFNNDQSSLPARQAEKDTSSCGVIAVEDLLNIIKEGPVPLNKAALEVGALSLRRSHKELIAKQAPETSRKAFLKRHGDRQGKHTDRVFYDDNGEIFGHVINRDGHILIDIKKAGVFDLNKIKDFIPCQSLTINAPDSLIAIEGKLNVSGEIKICAKEVKLSATAEVKTSRFIVITEKAILDGKIDSLDLQVNTDSLCLKSALNIYSQGKEYFNQKSQVILKAKQMEIEGGKINTNQLIVNSDDTLRLPSSMQIQSDQIKLVGKQVKVASKITANICEIEADEALKIGKDSVICATHCSLAGDNIEMTGQLKNVELLDINATDNIRLDVKSKIDTINLNLNAKKIETLGELQNTNLNCHADHVKLAGHISSHLNKDNPDKPTTFTINASSLEVDGKIETDSKLSINSNKIFMSSRGKIQPRNNTCNPRILNLIKCSEKLYLEEGAEITSAHNLRVETKDFVHYGLIKSKSNLILEINGSGEIHDSGKVCSDANISLQGSRCWNSGDVDAKETLSLSFDAFFINGVCDFNVASKLKAFKLLGKLHGGNIIITTALFMGMLSEISSDNSIQLNAFLNLYMGVMNAQNIFRSTIGQIDLGFNVTALEKIKSLLDFMRKLVSTISSDQTIGSLVKEQFKGVSSQDIAMSGVSYALQLASIAAKVTAFFAPQAAFIANLCLGASSTLLQLSLNGLSVKREVSKLLEQYRGGHVIHPYDIYRLILNTKNIALSAANTATIGLNMPTALEHIPTAIQSTHDNLINALPTVAGIFGGSISDQSVFDVDAFSANITGLASSMTAAHLSAFKETLTAVNIDNSLLSQEQWSSIIASLEVITAQHYTQHGGTHLLDSETISAKQVKLKGDINAEHLNVVADDLTQSKNLKSDNAVLQVKNKAQMKGEVDLANGGFQADSLEVTKEGHTHLSHMTLKVNKTQEDGQFIATNCSGRLGAVSQAQSGDCQLTGTIENQQFVHGLALDGANFKGALKTDSIALVSSKQVTATGPVDATLSSIRSEEGIQLAGTSKLTDTQLVAKGITEVGGVTQMKGGRLETGQLNIAQGSKASMEGVDLDVQQTEDAGILDLNACAGKLGKINQSQGGSFTVTDSYLQNEDGSREYTNNIELAGGELKGTFAAKDAQVHSTKEVNVGGVLQATGSAIKSDEDLNLNKGADNKITNSVLEGKNIKHEEGSKLQTDNATFIATDEIKMAGGTANDHTLALIAGKKVTFAETSQVRRGQDSEMIVKAPDIDKFGTFDQKKATFESAISSKKANQWVGDKDFKADTLEIFTDQDVNITTQITSSKDVVIVGRTVINNAEQTLNSLGLQSNVGNVENHKAVKTTGELTLIAKEGYMIMDASFDAKELYAEGKLGIKGCTPKPIYDQSTKKSALDLLLSGMKKKHERLPEKTLFNAPTIKFKSEGNVSLTGVDLVYNDLIIDTKGNFYLNGRKANSSFFDVIPKKEYKTRLMGPNTTVTAHNFVNNGQSMIGGETKFILDGNFVNKNGGVISASNYLSVKANNIINECANKYVQTQYGPHIEYTPSILSGGMGINHEGVGLYLEANSLTLDASIISSWGSNVLNINGNIDILARSNEYTSSRTDKSGGLFGLQQEHSEVRETIVGRSCIASAYGQNRISAKEGHLEATATDFVAKSGTYIFSKEGSRFYDLVTSRTETKEKKNYIFHSNEKRRDEFSSPTVIYDQTGVTLVSDKDIAMRGTTITTPGHLDVQARNFESTVSKLVHTYHGDSFGMSATLCNQQFLATNTSTNFSSPFYNGDPTANQLNRLANSNGWIEGGLNSFATGINLVNTTNAALNGFRTGTLLQEALKHELPNLYAPSLGINFTWSSTDIYAESLGEGGFNVGSATFNVKDTVKFKGTPAQSLADFIVNCQNFTVEGEQLRSKVDQKTTNVNFTVSAKGDPYQVGVSTSHGQSATTAQANGMMQVGGKLTVNADTMTLDGATVDAGQIAGAVKTLNVISRQDETHCESSSLGVSTGGDFCISQQASDSRTLAEAAGIHVHNSINSTPGEFTVGAFNSVGGQITSDGVNNFAADKINAKDLVDSAQSRGFGINGNIKDFKQDTQVNHLLPQDKQSAQITTTNLNFNKSDYAANNHTVINGAQGTEIKSGSTSGNIITQSSDGKEITKDSSHSYNVVIPHVTPETAEQFEKNKKWAGEKFAEGKKIVSDFFKPAQKNPETSFISVDNKHEAMSHHDKKAKDIHKDDLPIPDSKSQAHSSKQEVKDTNSNNNDNHPDISKDEAYQNGKLAALTGYMPTNIDDYPRAAQTSFNQGYSDTKGATSGGGIALIGLAVIGIVATGGILGEIGAVAMEMGESIAALAWRTYGTFSKVESIGKSAIDFVSESLQNVEKEIETNLLNNKEVRDWYIAQLKEIPNKLDSSLPIRDQGLRAFILRNELKMQARTMMADPEEAATLPPPSSLRKEVKKQYDRGNVGDNLWEEIVEGSQRTNKIVDEALGIETKYTAKR